MKKFTNLEKIEELKEINPSINKLVEKLISTNLTVSYNGNSDDIIGKDIKIEGSEKLVESLNKIIDEEVNNNNIKLLEKLKYSPIRNNQLELNKQIELLEKSKFDDIVYSPEDIFDESDYKKSNKLFILESMNNIPFDFLHRLNKREILDYFSNGNKVSIIYEGLNKGWTLSFVDGNDYGTSIDDENVKYQYFIRENAEFIADFIAATSTLIGTKNLRFDKKLFK